MSEIASGISSFAENGHSVDRKSTRLNSSHVEISYAVFCLKKKKKNKVTIAKYRIPPPTRIYMNCYNVYLTVPPTSSRFIVLLNSWTHRALILASVAVVLLT